MELNDLKNVLESSPVAAVSTFILLILGILFLVLKDRSLSPGPRGLPYFGYWPFLKNDTAHIQLQELSKKYGDVYTFTATGRLYIHLGSIKALKEAHVTKGDCFGQRATDFNVLNFLFSEGLVSLNDEPWRVLRKFFVQSFREFGLSSMKDYMSGPIYDSMASTVNRIKSAEGKPINVTPILTYQSSTILRRTLFNDEGATEEELMEIVENYESIFSLFLGTRALLHGEFARRVIFPLMSDFKTAKVSHKKIVAVLRKIFKRHEETYNEGSIRDVVDSYIKERDERRRRKDPSAEYFTEKSLVSSLIQIVGDGISAVALTICGVLNAMLEYPEEQEKISKELEEVLGPDREPTLEDKSKLPYTNAFILEVLRTSDFFTIFPSLECTKETTISGCKVPVGAITLLNMWACHRDPKVFEDPNSFKPSRYISEPGKQKQEHPISFGSGKRACAGESYTMMQVFLCVTTIIKNFRLTRPTNIEKKSAFDTAMEIIALPRKHHSL